MPDPSPFEQSPYFREARRAAEFPQLARLEAQAKLSVQKDATMLRELKRRGYDWSAALSQRQNDNSFESACSQEVQRMIGFQPCDRAPSSSYKTITIPFEAFSTRDTSDYVIGSTSAGAAMVETEIQDKDPIQPLRATSAMLRAGCDVIESDKHNISIPRIGGIVPFAGSGETQTTWVTGSGTSPFNTEAVPLRAVWYSSQIAVSNQIMAQAADRKIAGYIVDLLKTSIGKMVDALALNGSGATNGQGQLLQALGLLNYPVNTASTFDPGMLAPSVSFGSPPTQANIAQMIFSLDSLSYDDDDNDARVWLCSPSVRQVLSTTPAISGQSAVFLFDWLTKRIGPYRSITTNQLTPTNQLVLLDSREPVFLAVSGVHVTLDAATYAASYQTLITVGMLMDFGMKRCGAVISSNAANG